MYRRPRSRRCMPHSVGISKKTKKLLAAANAGARDVWDKYVSKNPGLRGGSFGNALEELAEAEMFVFWRQGGPDATVLVPPRQELAGGLLRPIEYLGALSDFT